MHLRARYGHGGRLGYEREWRADPARSGGGELIDQGMHLLDLSHWLAGPLPLHSALLRTHFWDTPVEDNAALILGEADSRTAPWATAARQLDRVEEPVLAGDLLPRRQARGRRAGRAPTGRSVCASTAWDPSSDRRTLRGDLLSRRGPLMAARVG